MKTSVLLTLLSLFVFSIYVQAQTTDSAKSKDKQVTQKLPTVVSINLCADQLVLAFADEAQILSLSNLSHDAAGSVYAAKARRYPVNTGLVEEVLPLQPDLVIAGQFTSRYTLQLLQSVGLKVEILPIADSIETLQQNLLDVSRWLEQQERGEAEVQRIRERLAALSEVTVPKPRAAVFDPNGYTVGDNSLRGQSLNLAGWHNVATDRGIQSYGSLSLESMILLKPDALFESPYSPDTWSRGQALSVHPAIKSRGLNTKIIHIPSAHTICGGPWTLDTIEQLQHERIRLQARMQSDAVKNKQ